MFTFQLEISETIVSRHVLPAALGAISLCNVEHFLVQSPSQSLIHAVTKKPNGLMISPEQFWVFVVDLEPRWRLVGFDLLKYFDWKWKPLTLKGKFYPSKSVNSEVM